MTSVFVQFSDASQKTVVAVFGCPQDEVAYPNQAQIDASDSRYLAFINPVSQLSGARAAQFALVASACQAALLDGFASSAVGTTRSYPSQDTDQRNLQSAVSASIGAAAAWTTPLWCASAGAWSMTSHTAAQVQQVNADWLAFRVAPSRNTPIC
jgi:hypothetical protein